MTSSFAGARDTYSDQALLELSRRFRKIILWGLTPPQTHSHFHIYYAYFRTCKRLGLAVEWLPDSAANAALIERDDLVFIHGSTNHFIPQVLARNPVIVDFHVDQVRERLGDLVDVVAAYERRITERERHEADAEFWDPATSFSRSSKILTQPWGADLLRQEFAPPADSHWSDKMYWLGAWWANEHWGNYDEIAALKQQSEAAGLRFVQFSDCTTTQNQFFISQSRLGASIGGAGQVRSNYLACRFFKNIAYGQFSVSNVPMSQQLLQGSAIYSPSVAQAVAQGLEVGPARARELLTFQQHCIRNYTVAAHIYLILLAATEYSIQ
jgi:hypothetical protein